MSNPQSNRTDVTVSALDMTAIAGGFTTVNTKLATYVQGLTENERESLFSLAEENLVFTNDVFAQATVLNASLPAAAQTILSNMSNDMTLGTQMNTIIETMVMPVMRSALDTKRLADHEAYTAALALYKIIEAMAELGIPGFQAAYDILKVRFANQGRPSSGNNQ
jgi:hypothetical protein